MATNALHHSARWRNSARLATSKIDTMRTSGFYEVSDPAGLPAGDYHLLSIRSFAKDVNVFKVKHIAFAADNSGMWTREHDGFAWGLWAQPGETVLDTGFVQSFSRKVPSWALSKFSSTVLDVAGGVGSTLGSPVALPWAATPKSRRYPNVFYTQTAGINQSAGVNLDGLFLSRAFGFEVGGVVGIPSAYTGTQQLFLGIGVDSFVNILQNGPDNVGNIIGIGNAAGVPQLTARHNDNVATAIATPLDGPGVPVIDINKFYEFYIQCDPGASVATVRLTDLDTGEVWSQLINNNLPTQFITMSVHAVMSNGATGGLASLMVHNLWANNGPTI